MSVNAYCYSQRMLNPFRGLMNVIELGNADAVSIDGVQWTLYLRDEALQGIANDGDTEVEVPDIKFATWSEKHGLKRAPLLNTMEYDAVQYAGEQLLEAVRQHYQEVPFPQHDNYELWLLDKYMDQPLALLHSACYPADMAEPYSLSWNCGQKSREYFRSLFLQQTLVQACNHANWLTQQVNIEAGDNPRVQWFLRDARGGGTGLHSMPHEPSLEGRVLASDSFPGLMLYQDWVNEDMNIVVNEFLTWRAPWLLVLQNLSDKMRCMLETCACKQALLLAEQERLYPKIIDTKAINAALVEAMLRRANDVEDKKDKDVIPVYYLSGQYY